MATPKIPLNTFKLFLSPLVSGSNVIYQENTVDVSAIILSLHLTNLTEEYQRATVKIQKNATVTTLIKNAIIPPEEALNPFNGRVVLEKGNALIVETEVDNVLDSTLSMLENANA